MFEHFTPHKITTDEVNINLVIGGQGPPLLLLHGYPQTYVMWHEIAPKLAQYFTVICPDLRGYGDSGHPRTDDRHSPYSKRAMAQDQVEVMEQLGFRQFLAVGHDRGARVLHRLLLDYPERVQKAALLDIVPTKTIFETINQTLATAYSHWFFLIEPAGIPEKLIGSDPAFYLTCKLRQWSHRFEGFSQEAIAEYIRCFSNKDVIHSTCEDYRAAASIDLEHDRADLDTRIQCPLLILWGQLGVMERCYDVLATWRERAVNVQGFSLPCGHFLPEEAPEETTQALLEFLTIS
ncbi:alpha/beta hydrolase [Roseofilum sp. Guam]|uniref:alpha/beta fold hydrolase n=1 Tax=Roseofilum sp. Guam TaxID=2821502 RepID=UPI001B25A2C9|nr:alpha/beta hydrolase [Roseofilum sp. Guam]MBP0030694.1 alpha/beta hydrolase [Roseofilum sp. Guam]